MIRPWMIDAGAVLGLLAFGTAVVMLVYVGLG